MALVFSISGSGFPLPELPGVEPPPRPAKASAATPPAIPNAATPPATANPIPAPLGLDLFFSGLLLGLDSGECSDLGGFLRQ